MSVPRGVSRGARSPDVGFTGLHGLFEAQARRSPDAHAVVHRGRTLTYADLDGRAGRLAAHLRAVGVARGSIIAVCASPSIELLVSLIAVLKAGGAYLPIDPATPRTRLADLLAGSRPSRVLVDATALGAFKGLAANIVVVGDDDTRWTREGPLARGGTAPEELAYVIQTSGSTGIPKGVMVPHRGILQHPSVAAGDLSVSARGSRPADALVHVRRVVDRAIPAADRRCVRRHPR